MKRILFASLLLGGSLSACMPTQQAMAPQATVTPVLYHASPSVARGGTLTLQGRYLGGPDNSVVRMAANADGEGGFVFPRASVQSWTGNQIVLTIPADAPVGGGWIFAEVDGLRSSGLPYAISR